MSNELKTIQGDITPAAMLKAAIDRGADISQLGSLMALYEKFEANRARALFNEAIAHFKEDAPAIFKTKHVTYGSGKADFWQSELDELDKVLTPALAQYELSYHWTPETLDSGHIKITCTLDHVGGASRSASMQGPPDNSGGKSPIQAIASTSTLLMRYTLLSVLGMAAKKMPDAGHERPSFNPDEDKITDEQVLTIEAFILDNELPMEPVMQYLKSKGHEKFAELPAKSFDQFMATLKRSAAAKVRG